jgi:ferrochelatase
LEEIAIRAKETFLDAGGESFEFIPCMNTQPLWVQTVTNWIKDYFNGDTSMLMQ